MSTVDPLDIKNFENQAHLWWDYTGPFRPLHEINPHRVSFIKQEICKHFKLKSDHTTPLNNLSILDIGCGGGLVCEPLTRLGADITGIDAGEANIQAARAHATDHGLNINYRHTTAETLAATNTHYDVVIALEIVEHVADIPLFLKSCVDLVKPGGLLIMSTLNRTIKSYALGIIAAEYILKWVPKGTHQWKQFVEPADLALPLEDLGMVTQTIKGLEYNIFKRSWGLSNNTDVNYFLSAAKPS